MKSVKVVDILDCGIYSTLPFRFEYELEQLILSRFFSNKWIAKNKKQKTPSRNDIKMR